MQPEMTPREKVFRTASRLFYEQGYQATGVDTIAAEAGVGKMTLYRHFPSKDELIAAFLRESDEQFWSRFEQSTGHAPTPRDTLLAFFDALGQYVTSPACHGCPFSNVASEFRAIEYEGHQVALRHKRAVRERFKTLATRAGARDPGALADALHLLMDGAYMAARMYGASPDNPGAAVATAARQLINAHCAPA